MFQFTKSRVFKLSSVLLADLNQVQFLFSNLEQLIEKQSDEISQLENKVVKLKTANDMLVDANIEMAVKTDMIENVPRLGSIK